MTPPENRGRLLAVDDSEVFLRVLAENLRDEGFEVITAGSGARAVEILGVEPVDCVLTDLRMPEISGEDLCRIVRGSTTWRDLPIVVLSSSDGDDAVIAAMDAGADDFVWKGAALHLVTARIRAQLRRRQMEVENRQIRDELAQRQLEAADARASRELAETRAALLLELQIKNAELQLANEALRGAKQVAEQESRFKSRFLARMSHELRTPLNAILGFSELLEQQLFGPLNPRQLEYVGHLHQSGRQLLRIVTEVLDLSKVETGHLPLDRSLVRVEDVAGLEVDLLRPLAQRKEVALELEVAPELPAVEADAERIRQVLSNLLSNALKFTDEGGRIVVRVRSEGGEVCLDVADTGIGIAAADLPRLFQDFERLDADGVDGARLGLTVAHKLVELHGGRILVVSAPGVGTTFSVRLPAAR